jgi:patatin-like phospholipase/acyl hydrolase
MAEQMRKQPQLPVRVLAIDGGGVRGIFPSHVLVALEELTEQPVASLFDVIVGTSIGGIGALALSAPNEEGKPDLTARDVLGFFRLAL